MQKNEDGSVVLTKQELKQLNSAYHSLYTILDNMPAFLGDYFSNHEKYINVEKWHFDTTCTSLQASSWSVKWKKI